MKKLFLKNNITALILSGILTLTPVVVWSGDGHNHGDEGFATQNTTADSFDLTLIQIQNLGLKSQSIQKHLFFETVTAPAVLKYPSFESKEIQAQGFIQEGAEFGTLTINQKVILTLDAYPNRSFEGTITRIEPLMDSKSRLYTFWATLSNLPRQSSGLKGILTIQTGASEEAIGVPQNAVNGTFGDLFVFVKKDTHFEKRPVLKGHTMGNLVEIAAGLKGTEEVVTTGSYQLQYVSGVETHTEESSTHIHDETKEKDIHLQEDETHPSTPHAHEENEEAHTKEHREN